MKTFKINYEFFNRDDAKNKYWDIASAVVVAEDDHKASELFYSEVDDQSATILEHHELKTKQIIWAY